MKRPALYLLDTNTASFVVTGRSPAARASYEQVEMHSLVAISTISEGEIRFGIEKRPKDRKARDYMEEFLARTIRLSWDSAAAAAYGRLRAELSRVGVSLGALDMLIAAHAVSAGATLVTHDQGLHRANRLVPMVNWATDI